MPQEKATIDGFPCYAPALAQENEDYPAALFDQLYRLEAGHFWFQARNRIILRMLRQYLPRQGCPRVLEIGCGTGFVLQGLATESRYALTGSEAHLSGLRHARKRLPLVEFIQADARDLPYRSVFDAIGAFDVIEHVGEDETVLSSVRRALKPGGIFIMTVPQHMWLWSATDDLALHKRRYTRPDLSNKLMAAGFEILRCTSFVTTLLPIMYLSRRVVRERPAANKETGGYELEISPLANLICSAAMRIDEALIAMGISLPVGGSLLAVARSRTR
jgi:SAM-dependent methyltransferase